MRSSGQTRSSAGTLRHDSVPIPSVDQSLPLKLLPLVLSLAAGSVDVIGFLGLVRTGASDQFAFHDGCAAAQHAHVPGEIFAGLSTA